MGVPTLLTRLQTPNKTDEKGTQSGQGCCTWGHSLGLSGLEEPSSPNSSF